MGLIDNIVSTIEGLVTGHGGHALAAPAHHGDHQVPAMVGAFNPAMSHHGPLPVHAQAAHHVGQGPNVFDMLADQQAMANADHRLNAGYDPHYQPVAGERGFFADPNSPTGLSFSSGHGGVQLGIDPSHLQAQHHMLTAGGIHPYGALQFGHAMDAAPVADQQGFIPPFTVGF